ncbi:CAP domain-containing protein [Streptomyces violascens]|uniref:CAP domain-containing protein n=1 Tax=Streptomyces violascens TaxID=67381 RepID=UPI00365DBA65
MTTSPPRRHAKRLALAVGVLSAVLASTAPYATAQPAPTTPAATATATTVQEYYPNVDHIVCAVNKERADKGLSPLLISDRASNVAQNHARDMASMGKLTSTGSDGRL